MPAPEPDSGDAGNRTADNEVRISERLDSSARLTSMYLPLNPNLKLQESKAGADWKARTQKLQTERDGLLKSVIALQVFTQLKEAQACRNLLIEPE